MKKLIIFAACLSIGLSSCTLEDAGSILLNSVNSSSSEYDEYGSFVRENHKWSIPVVDECFRHDLSPVVIGDIVIYPFGESTLKAVDVSTGAEKWSCQFQDKIETYDFEKNMSVQGTSLGILLDHSFAFINTTNGSLEYSSKKNLKRNYNSISSANNEFFIGYTEGINSCIFNNGNTGILKYAKASKTISLFKEWRSADLGDNYAEAFAPIIIEKSGKSGLGAVYIEYYTDYFHPVKTVISAMSLKDNPTISWTSEFEIGTHLQARSMGFSGKSLVLHNAQGNQYHIDANRGITTRIIENQYVIHNSFKKEGMILGYNSDDISLFSTLHDYEQFKTSRNSNDFTYCSPEEAVIGYNYLYVPIGYKIGVFNHDGRLTKTIDQAHTPASGNYSLDEEEKHLFFFDNNELVCIDLSK